MVLERPVRHAGGALALLLLGGCGGAQTGAPTEAASTSSEAVSAARFEWFKYSGNDPVFEVTGDTLTGYLNPVLAGFYPDPSVTRAGNDYYLVTSTFGYFPGIPVMHSRDLVNWEQVGNVIDRPGMLDFDGLGLSRGVFAPTIEFHDGTFYVANTCVDCGGNFIVTTNDPAGPWSNPVWLPDVGGIDPSLIFDEDGKVYVMNNDAPPEAALYEGHRAIWIREVDPKTFQSISEPVVLINGGVRPEEKPIWIEGPHIYRIGDWYYLSAAEGGTAVEHSQVVLRSRDVTGPYVPYDANPILTQRDQPADRPNPITSVGHADLVQDGAGRWWATFLGVRPYEGDMYNTGRETFLLPVDWSSDWPVILPKGQLVPHVVSERPSAPPADAPPVPLTGNFEQVEEFGADRLPYNWMTLRVPTSQWWTLQDGELRLAPRPVDLGAGAQPSFWGRRQQHQNATAETSLIFTPEKAGEEAGLAVLQSDDYFYAMGLVRNESGEIVIQLRRKAGSESLVEGEQIAAQQIALAPGAAIKLRITARGDVYDFAYQGEGQDDWVMLAEGLDGKILSTHVAGGFVGAVLGVYAQSPERAL
ncbi:MAG: glycoside hydrolase family 43 protein [Alphaproteobacteria bacterium]|nr:glycoside hydrolase family 43 protein [Alphaproteobacteria bacterium]MBU2085160.1 glycoside hydrolase family 43 protein [Alphaproteobacteria bacterium]MBU2142090.1 glycoside hydrolase family 43 protein [Alphaproteobacteria bacterium]MBU2196982.1 glycoside hydrolase family 43 protein [Alphaproteobacteria bacterium]